MAKGSSFKVEKKMQLAPRKIAELIVELTLPSRLTDLERKVMEEIAHTCPVAKSLSPDILLPVTFKYELL